MSNFTQEVVLSQKKGSDDRWIILNHDLEWISNDGRTVLVPFEFDTDLASVPRIFWAIIPPFGRHMQAAVVHDYLYSLGGSRKKRSWADRQFFDGMVVMGTPKFRAYIMWAAVRLFGWNRFYRKKR